MTSKEAKDKYLEYLEGHIGNVQEALDLFLTLDIPFINDNEAVLRKILSNHDKSKYDEPEWAGYLHHFYPISDEDSLKTEEFEEACSHHIKSNPHHWDYWIKDGKLVDDIDENEYKLYCVERCADWCAMSIQNDNSPLDWYNANKDYIIMPDYGYDFCEEILNKIPKDFDLSYHGTRTEGKPERESIDEHLLGLNKKYIKKLGKRAKIGNNGTAVSIKPTFSNLSFNEILSEYGNSGYIGSSKSVRASQAESLDRYPASVAAKLLGVSAASIKAILSPSEWHHTGSYYNRTDYYDIELLLAMKNNDEDIMSMYDDEEIQEARNQLEELKSYKAPELKSNTYKANVRWLTWSGTRNHPKATEHIVNNVDVTERGSFYYFKDNDGNDVKKKIGSNGTEVTKINESTLLEVKASQLRNKTKSEDPARVKKSRNVKTTYIGMSKFGILNFKTTSESRSGYHYQTVEFQSMKPLEEVIKRNGKVTPDDVKKALNDQDMNVFCTCFVGDTKVLMSDGSYKKIEEIEIGDKVISHTGEEREVTSQMINYFTGSLIVINGVRSTPNHPYLVLDKDTVCWKEAKDITADMKLLKPAKKYGYIYMTTNLLNGRRYIGQHHSDKLDENYFGSGSVISKAVKKYGKDSFKVDLLEWCYSKEDLDKKEQYYISEYMANIDRDFYNIAKGGSSFNCSGYKIIHKGDIHHYVHPDSLQSWYDLGYELGESEARCSAKSEISKKFLNSPDFLAKREMINKKISEHSRKPHKKGYHLSDEHKAKISRFQKGRPKSEETKRKMSESASRWQNGRTLSDETKIKISITMSERVKDRKRDSHGRFSKEVKDDRV